MEEESGAVEWRRVRYVLPYNETREVKSEMCKAEEVDECDAESAAF
jgi:hypothetical protein